MAKDQGAVGGLKERGLIQLTRLPAATLSALQRQLRQEQYHIFHYIGHGGFDQQTQDGVLLLEDENGRSRLVNGNYLGTLLHDHPSLRLAVLNACEGARTTRSDPFAGVAQQLVRQGIPAVIAMQFEITDRAAIILAQEFYDALADGYPVDAALAEARKSIYTAGNDIEWGTPVLYLRAVDGQLFDLHKWQAKPPHLNRLCAKSRPLWRWKRQSNHRRQLLPKPLHHCAKQPCRSTRVRQPLSDQLSNQKPSSHAGSGCTQLGSGWVGSGLYS